MAEIYVTEYKMLTFKEYILLEDRVNWSKYGSWINAKTREVLDVDDQEHEDVMHDYIVKKHPKIIKKIGEWRPGEDMMTYDGEISANEWAIDNDWVRLVHKSGLWSFQGDMALQGNIKNIKKMWRMIAKKAMKSILDIDLSRRGGARPFASKSFNMTLPKERNKWLKHM